MDEGLTALCAESFSYAYQQCRTIGVNAPANIFLTVLPYRWWPDDFGLRLVPALFGIATVPALYCLVRRWSTRAGALSAALLLTLSPLHLHHSQDARPYSLMMFCTVLSTLALDKLREGWRGDAKTSVLAAWASCYGLAALLNLYNHYFAILVVGVQFCWLFAHLPPLRERIKAAVCCGILMLAVVAGFSPWFGPVLVLANQSWVRSGLTGTPLLRGGEQLHVDVDVTRKPVTIALEAVQGLMLEWTQGLALPSPAFQWTWILQLGFAVAGGIILLRRDRSRALLVGSILFTALLYVALAAPPLVLYSKVPLYFRHVAFGYPMFVALMATALDSLRAGHRALFGPMAGLLVLSNAPGLASYYQTPNEDWRGVSEFIAGHVRSGDQILMDSADWGLLAHLQRWGFEVPHDRNPAVLRKGDMVVELSYQSTAPDRSRRVWWIHAETAHSDSRLIDPEACVLKTEPGVPEGALSVYEHPPER